MDERKETKEEPPPTCEYYGRAVSIDFAYTHCPTCEHARECFNLYDYSCEECKAPYAATLASEMP